jgi:hypothetical protein
MTVEFFSSLLVNNFANSSRIGGSLRRFSAFGWIFASRRVIPDNAASASIRRLVFHSSDVDDSGSVELCQMIWPLGIVVAHVLW